MVQTVRRCAILVALLFLLPNLLLSSSTTVGKTIKHCKYALLVYAKAG